MANKTFPRCSAATKDGTQCGRRVKDDSIPPLCHIHLAQQQGRSVSPLTEPAEIDEEAILKKLMRDPDPAIRLRAVGAWLDYKAKKRDAAQRPDDWRPFFKALTDDERARMLELLQAVEDFKETIYARDPTLRPDGEPPPPRAPRNSTQSV